MGRHEEPMLTGKPAPERQTRAERDDWAGDGSRVKLSFKSLDEEQVARALGWLSVGLGLAELAAPRAVARLIGVPEERRILLRALGLRELVSGVGILTHRKPAGWLWSRVAGDAMDLALLRSALKWDKAERGRVAAATAALVGVSVVDVVCSLKINRSAGATTEDGSIRVQKAVTVSRSPEEVYRFWRDFQNLHRFMKHVESVHRGGESRWHWVVKGPAGARVEWDAEITADEPGRLIAWRSIEGAGLDNSGSVRFEPAPGRRGTIVRAEMQYKSPAGIAGAAVAKLFGKEPEQQIQEDLRRFKQVIEAGEIITTEGQPAGRPSSTSWKYDRAMRIAAPGNGSNVI